MTGLIDTAAFGPEADVALNTRINWDFVPDFENLVLTHEFGHVMGIGHSDVDEALMAPSLGDQDGLHPDDILAATAAYPTGGVEDITVTVEDDAGSPMPIEGAEVQLIVTAFTNFGGLTEFVAVTLVTSADGIVVFEDLSPDGIYRVEADAKGFDSDSDAGLTAGDSTTLTLGASDDGGNGGGGPDCDNPRHANNPHCQ